MKYFLSLITILILIGCGSSSTTSEHTWHGSMQGLATSLTEIMPNLVTTSWGDKNQQRREMQKVINQLENYSDTLDPTKLAMPTNDPSIEFLARDFNSAIQKIKTKAKKTAPNDMKSDIRNLAQYCVACHTRTPSGNSYFTAKMDRHMKGFDNFERATYLTAFRQYEKAMVNYETALTNKAWATKHPEKWNEAAMNLLAISVRVKRNPNLTLELLSQLFDTKSIPKDLHKAARVWQRDAKAWNKEKKSTASLAKVESLLRDGLKKDKQMTHSGLLQNVRASAILSQYLQAGGMKTFREQGFLYYSGVIAERLEKLGFSEFPESYYNACIAVDPKGHYTERCKKRLKRFSVAKK